jgi:DNA polymerase-3 subunit beta
MALTLDFDHVSDARGETTVSARKLLDICRAIPDGAVLEITQDENRFLLKSGKSRFVLSPLPANEFPRMGEFQPSHTLQVKGKVLAALIKNTQFAMAHQDVRYYLNGLMLEISSTGLRAIATDGHRMAMSECPFATEIAEPQQVIVPRKAVAELSKMLEAESEEEVSLLVGANHLQVVLGRHKLTSKLIDGRFPDYERVLSKKGDKLVLAEREPLRQALARASILSNEKLRGVRIAVEADLLKLSAQNAEGEEAEEEVEVKYAGEPIEIGFNVAYLLDVLSTIKTEAVRIELGNAASGCYIRPEGATDSHYVVMPMRL